MQQAYLVMAGLLVVGGLVVAQAPGAFEGMGMGQHAMFQFPTEQERLLSGEFQAAAHDAATGEAFVLQVRFLGTATRSHEMGEGGVLGEPQEQGDLFAAVRVAHAVTEEPLQGFNTTVAWVAQRGDHLSLGEGWAFSLASASDAPLRFLVQGTIAGLALDGAHASGALRAEGTALRPGAAPEDASQGFRLDALGHVDNDRVR